MGYNTKAMSTRTMVGLVNSGADLITHMYDVRIWFPSENGTPEDSDFSTVAGYPITVRAEGFKIPDVSVKTYPIEYHGMKMNRPAAALEEDRTFDITFREDAAFDLRRRFSAWLMAVGDPVTGGVSNATQFFGKVQVGTIGGAYFATTTASPTGDGSVGAKDLFGANGNLVNKNPTINPLALWGFYNVWVNKMTGIDFKTGAGDANKFTVTFQYMHMDYPQFGGNTLDLGGGAAWME